MLPVACYVASSTYRIFPALCNAAWVVVVCVGGGGRGILKEPFALASGHCKNVSQSPQLVFKVDSRKERKENSVY